MKTIPAFALKIVLFCLILLSGKVGLIAQASGAPTEFSPHGPGGGGYMYAPSISPHDPNHIFLNCDMGGIYRSQDGAQTFQMLHRDQVVSMVKGKVQFTSDPNVLYLLRRSLTNHDDPLWRGELAKSTDGGATWQAMPDPTGSGAHYLAVDPGSTQRLLLTEYNQLFFSANGGASWTSVFQPSDEKIWVGGVFWDGQNIFVGTDKGLLVSKNGGASFALETHSGLPAGAGIYHLAGAKSGATTRLFCIAAPADDMYAWYEPLTFQGNLQGLFKMNYTTGAAWTAAQANIPADVSIAWVDLSSTNTQQVWAAGANPNGLVMIFKSTNGGNAWSNTFQALDNQNVATGWGGDGGPFSYLWGGGPLGFDVSDSNPNEVITTDGFGHITTDGGASWRATYVKQAFQNPVGQLSSVSKFYQSSGLDVTTGHQLFWLNDQEMFACNTDIGQTFSTDAGETWTFAHNLFAPWGTVTDNNWYRIVRRPDNGHLFAATSELNDMYHPYRISDAILDGTGGLVLRSTDNGALWDTLHNFGHPVAWIELDKNVPTRLYASVIDHAEGGIYRSNDSGQTWARLPAPPRTQGHPYNIVSLNDGGLVVTFSARDEDGSLQLTESSGVFYLPNGSNTWQDRTAPAMKYYTKDLVVDAHDPAQQTWYATVWGRVGVWPQPNNTGNGGVYRSTDRGLTWTRIFEHELAESITIHPDIPTTAYVTTENDGLYFTENLGPGATFERVAAFPFWRPKRVFFKPGNHDEVWVTTMGGGLWKGTAPASQPGVVTYTPSTEDFANPERGFIHQTNTHSSNYEPLDANELASWRNLHQPFSASYSIYTTLVYRGFYLEDFTNSPISNTYLTAMAQDFAAARQAGVKLNVRFAYTDDDQGGTPPFSDAPKNMVLQHIAQLKPLLQANADVIALVEMGFVGVWGEGYYTDYFGFGELSAQNWSDRSQVLMALLDALPADRSVLVRYPQMKQKAIYGVMAQPNAAALTPGEAWQNTPKARIGFHNDCFLSSADDIGTYVNYDLNVSGSDTAAFKPYLAADSRFVPVGGETCVDWNPYSDCTSQPGGGAEREMARMHYSYLNAQYNNALNNDWVGGGCISAIKQRLGYRLELQSGEYSTEGRPGQTVSIKIELKNKGFAAPFNRRSVRLLLRNTSTQAIWHVDLPDDPRQWLPGDQTYTIQHSFCLPPDMPEGQYELLLHLADPYASLSNRPEYAIRLANGGNIWEASTGYNRLMHQITVNQQANNPGCSGETCFQPNVAIPPVANFSASVQSGCGPLTVTFSNPSAFCWEHQWSFPGGNPASSTDPNPTVVYANTGAFNVSLSVTNTAGTTTATQTGFIQVTPLPNPGFQVDANGLDVSFINSTQNADSYVWDFGDGETANTVHPTHHFATAGIYTVALTATNACGTRTYVENITVYCLTQTFEITVTGPNFICSNNPTVLNAPTGFIAYQWQQNGTVLGGVIGPSLTVTQQGLYSVTATNALGCQWVSNGLVMQAADAPVPVFSLTTNGFNASFFNTSQFADTYVWDFGDASPVVTDAQTTHTFPGPGAWPVTLFATNASCGTVSLTQTVEVACTPVEVSIAASPGAQVCAGESVLLTVSMDSFSSQQWYWNGEAIPGATDSSYLTALPGVYTLQATDAVGCSGLSNAVPVEIWPLPTVTIQPPGTVTLQAGEAVQLDAGVGFASWLWSTGATTSLISVDACGQYGVTVTDLHGCQSAADLVTVQVRPVIAFNDGVLVSSLALSYQWLLNGQPIPGATNQSYTPATSGSYAVATGCLGSDDLISAPVEVSILGASVVQQPKGRRLEIYPNPVTTDVVPIFLDLQDIDNQSFQAVLTDVAGRVLLEKTFPVAASPAEWLLDAMPAGWYGVQVWQSGRKIGVGRLLRF